MSASMAKGKALRGRREKERALKKTLEDAMADGVIEADEQKAIDLAIHLAKAEAAAIDLAIDLAKAEAAAEKATAAAEKAAEKATAALMRGLVSCWPRALSFLKVGDLLAKGADVHARDKDGATALMIASAKGYWEVVGQLLAKGADVNAQDKDGETALMRASAAGHSEVVGQLLAKGADVHAQNRAGATALSYTIKESDDDDDDNDNQGIHVRAAAGNSEVVGQLLDKASRPFQIFVYVYTGLCWR